MWLKSLKQHFSTKKRSQSEAASLSLTADDTGDLVSPISPLEDEEEFNSRPKRRSVSIDTNGARPEMRAVSDRRTSLEQWHEARRARNSMEGQGTTTTDRLTVCKAGTTTIVNKTYITIKHLGSGTFGRVMLAFNVYDQRLYAIKVCRKSQFAQLSHSRSHGRLRRGSHNSLQSPGSSAYFAARSCGGFSGVSNNSGTLSSVNVSCGTSCAAAGGQPRVTHIHATSATVHMANSNVSALTAAAAAASLLGSASSGFGTRSQGPFHAAAQAGWTSGQLQLPLQEQPQQQQQQLFGMPQEQQLQQQSKLRQSPSAFEQLQRSGRAHSLGAASAAAGGLGQFSVGPAGTLMSSGSTGWGNGLMGTDCSAGSMSAGSVFQDALMRFQTEELVKEIAILKKLNHPNIVNLVEVIDDPSIDSLLLVMEYVEGGTLEPQQLGSARWEPMLEKDVWRYVREVLQGLDYLHHHKVVHGDLKPANLLLDNNSNKVKIADFGSSIMTGGDKIFSMRNCPGFSTPAFRSPESLTSGYQPSFEMDMWALGVCIYMWVFGCLPFTGAASYIIYEKIRAQEIYMPPAPDVSPELKDFIAQLLEKDVLKRLDVLSAMQHPWVTLGGSAPLASIQQQRFAASMDVPSISMEGVVVSQEDIDAAIRQIGSSTYELMDICFEEVHLKQGQEFISPGDVADRIYLIAHGEVEIITSGAAQLAPHEPLVSGLDMDLSDPHDSSDVWDNTQVSDISKDPGTTSMMLLGDVLSPWDSSSSHAAGAAAFKLLAVKGPGDSLGVPLALSNGSNHGGNWQQRERRWRVHVRARGDVTVFTTKLGDLEKLVEAHPEMESAVKQMVTQQETDMMVAEAMRQLRLYNDCAHAHLTDSGCRTGLVAANS